ncbi:hypothetical protein KI387_022529, partial [Taxus chinensis]
MRGKPSKEEEDEDDTDDADDTDDDFFDQEDSDDDEEDKDDNEDDEDDEDVATSKTSRIDKAKIATPEHDSDDDEEEEKEEDKDMEDFDINDTEAGKSGYEEDNEDEEAPKMHAGKKRPIPDSNTKSPKTKKKARVATPQGQEPGEGKKSVQFSTHHAGAKKGSKKGKEVLGGSKQQPLTSTKTPISGGTPWPGKKPHSAANRAK